MRSSGRAAGGVCTPAGLARSTAFLHAVLRLGAYALVRVAADGGDAISSLRAVSQRDGSQAR
jgi:hypothetical protein